MLNVGFWAEQHEISEKHRNIENVFHFSRLRRKLTAHELNRIMRLMPGILSFSPRMTEKKFR